MRLHRHDVNRISAAAFSLVCIALVQACDRPSSSDRRNAAYFRALEQQQLNEEARREQGRQRQVEAAAKASLAKAIDFLLRQQGEDGAFRSTTYGALKQGPAMTSLALYAMAHVPEELAQPYRARLQRAYEFLRPGLEKTGQVAAPDGTLDYPTYDAAMVLIAARRLKLDLPDNERNKLQQLIIDMQLTEKHSIPADSIHYGGWDLEAAQGASGEQLKGSNMALTTLCLEALCESMDDEAVAAVRRARAWLAGAQNADGGYVFHPWRPHPGNKAMWKDEPDHNQAISYGTPTCDGLRAAHFAGCLNNDPLIRDAAKWLVEHPRVDVVPGFEKLPPEAGWHEGLRYYYWYTQAKALPLLDHVLLDIALVDNQSSDYRRGELIRILVAQQQSDGSYKNSEPRMFEDDPLLATSLAIVALAEVLK